MRIARDHSAQVWLLIAPLTGWFWVKSGHRSKSGQCLLPPKADIGTGPRCREVATNGLGYCNSLLAAATLLPCNLFASIRHSTSHFASNGLLRKSTAPFLIARVRSLSFGYAVTRITRHLISPQPQRFLQLKPALSRQLQVSDQACRLLNHARLKEVFGRTKC